MDGSKITPAANMDIHLALKFLKKVTKDVERAASNQLTSYMQRSHAIGKYYKDKMSFTLKTINAEIAHLKKSIFNCNIFLGGEDSKIIKTTSNNNRKHLHRNASFIMKIRES